MPKKSTPARGGAQRGRTKTQKSFELVRPVVETPEPESEPQDIAAIATASISKASTTATPPAAKAVPLVVPAKPVAEPERVSSTSAAPKAVASVGGSASSRLAARRQAGQTRTQRSATPLVTAEHYAYVRKDLMFIAILAIIMFATIIILHFTLA